MRLFWAAPMLERRSDIYPRLQKLKFVAPNQVSYTGKDMKTRVATTLKGILLKTLPTSVALEVFEGVTTLEKTVFSWSARGPRIIRQLFDRNAGLEPSKQGETPSDYRVPDAKNSSSPSGESKRGSIGPDIIGLQEYDVHNAIAKYSDRQRTFRAEMVKRGYCGLFFRQPKGDAGLAVYWKSSKFIFEPWRMNRGSGGTLVINCGQKMNRSAFNYDMHEKWHSVKRGKKGDQETLLPDGDRRNVGIVKLMSV